VKTTMNAFVRALAWVVLAALLLMAALCAVALHALTPKPGEWSVPVHWGPWQRQASVPTLLRWGTHPLVLPRLDGHTLATRAGEWQMKVRADGSLAAVCAPCRLQLDALGPQPVVISQARITLQPRGADRFDGTLWLGSGAQPAVLPWRAELKADGMHLHTELAPTPLQQVVNLFADAVPEARQARIDGRFSIKLDATLGEQGLQVQRITPKLEDVAVAGLGTEALIDSDASARCRPQPAAGRIEGWLPHAVLAAEDQRYYEHPGYEMDAWLAVWKQNQQQPDAIQGASTITQQLAKLLYNGDDRNAVRKLREWLYAVEMERSLGKGRILQLYLSVLPWGDGVCGAEAAARHHLGKPANKLTPREAAWLASLLINPELQLRRWARDEAAGRERVAWVLRGMRRLPMSRRESELEALASWQPPIARPLLAQPLEPKLRAPLLNSNWPEVLTFAAP
jgi:Transglycosylase